MGWVVNATHRPLTHGKDPEAVVSNIGNRRNLIRWKLHGVASRENLLTGMITSNPMNTIQQ
jgi:hypothetical protein